MDELEKMEFIVLGNILILLVLDAGGKVVISRDRHEEIHNLVMKREYDEETNSDTLEITGITNEVMM